MLKIMEKEKYIYDLALDTLPEAIAYEANTTNGLISYLNPPLDVKVLYAVSSSKNTIPKDSESQEQKPSHDRLYLGVFV